MQKYFLLLSLGFMSFFTLQKDPVKVYLVGDSTMSVKEVSAYPETGWGMPFAYFFDSTVTIENRAKNGRSTSSFIAENRWQPVVGSLRAGDYVFIQFGHNDEVPTKQTYTTPEAYRQNLIRYVTEARAKDARPVLLTPVARRKFDEAGKIVGTHDEYAQIVREVAKKHEVPLIDMDRKSQAMLQLMGEDKSKLLFNHLAVGEHPNYPNGVEDNTHFNELGARKMAQLVLSEIKTLHLDLADRIRTPADR